MITSAYLPGIILVATAIYLLGIRGFVSLVQSLITEGEVS